MATWPFAPVADGTSPFAASVKIAGAAEPTWMLADAVRPLLFTMSVAAPAASSYGICRFTCPGATYQIGAAIPFTVAATPESARGNGAEIAGEKGNPADETRGLQRQATLLLEIAGHPEQAEIPDRIAHEPDEDETPQGFLTPELGPTKSGRGRSRRRDSDGRGIAVDGPPADSKKDARNAGDNERRAP